MNVSVAWYSSGRVEIRCVLPVLWMTSCIPIIGHKVHHNATTAALLQCCAQANTPWLLPVLWGTKTDEFTCKECQGRSMQCSIAF